MCVVGKCRRLEVRRQADLKHIRRLFRRAERLWVGRAKRHHSRLEAFPYLSVRVGLLEVHFSSAGIRFRYGKGGMFMIERHGSFASAILTMSTRIVWLVYCGSCMARPTKSYRERSTSGGVVASNFPRKSREKIERCAGSSRSLMRTSVPSRLMSSAVFLRQ